jgi:glycosyltransferase involved in cell wall biosynthesis
VTRILHLIDSFNSGGSERQALDLIRLLQTGGKHEVFLASLSPEGVLRPEVEKMGLGEIPSYPLTGFYNRNAVTQLRRFVQHLRAQRIEVLHTNDFYTNIFGMAAGFIAGVPVRIASRRETGGMRTAAQTQLQKAAYSLAHQIVANSDSVRRKLVDEGVNGERITVIHSGVEPSRVLVSGDFSRDGFVRTVLVDRANDSPERIPKHLVTIVANMRHDVKDYPMFLRAARRVSKAVPDVGFLLAGEGELQESLKQLAAQMGISGNTFFLGRSENIAQLLNVSDVCVLSSKAEGFSNSILEYMAAGRPVVATDVGGAREVIVEAETGYIVPSGDDELMAERIISLLRDPAQARTMGEQGRRVVERRFSSRALLRNTEALYEKLLVENQRRSLGNVGADLRVRPRAKTGRTHRCAPTKTTQNEKPLRILVVAPSFDILGGQAVQAARLIARLRELPSLDVGFLPINPRLPGALGKLQAIKYLRTVVTSVLYIVNLLRKVPKFDVIHVFSASYLSFVIAPTPAILIAKLFGKKVLLNYHSGEAEDHLSRWRRSAVATIRLVDEIAVPSAYLVRVFAKFGIRAGAINNLIELDRFTFRERYSLRPMFLSNRNLETHYGVDHLLRAFALIQKQMPEAQLIVAGDGSQRSDLETLALDLELRNTKFVGRVEHGGIVEQYQSADIYLNGSEIDNQPLSILEAFACGLPVVTTNAGGIPDMVTDGETGFVVSRGDHEAIASRALRLLQEPSLAASMARTAREECKKYSWEAVRDQWSQLYAELAGQYSSGTESHAPAAGNTNTEPGAVATGSTMKQSHAAKAPSSETTLAKQITKLRRMSFAEVKTRSSQAVAAFAERTGWSLLTKLPSDRGLTSLLTKVGGREPRSTESLLEHFRRRKNSGFFEAFIDSAAVVAELRSRWPEAEAEIIAEANRILAGRFDLLGFNDLSFGTPINWHFEPVSGKAAPLLHWSRLDYLNSDVTGDKKIVWELNRHQYFLKLGQAYWLTRDEKYAAGFVAHLNSWMDQNPPKQGINWASSLEISFRSISWLWALHYFQNSPSLDAETFTRALKFLYLNARHLETYLSTYFSPNTHLTGEALGLFYLGTLLPQFREAARWRAKGQKILLAQLEPQVKADGVYFEQSSYYHRYTADFYTHLLILSEPPALAGGQPSAFNTRVQQKLQLLLDHLMYITHPDGTSPLFGDDDGGRLVSLDRRAANDFRAALSTGAALFERGDYKFVAGGLAEETLWLLGPRGAQTFDQLNAEEPAQQSKNFPDGGYYVMRDGWHKKANYLLFDCGPHGTSNCGHAHADALAIEVAAKGRPLLVDPGTYTYTGSRELRDLFRGASAHNVLLVDGEPSSVPAGPFSWTTTARCEPVSWISERRFDYVAGGHDGYQRLPEPARHTRGILFLKNDYWLMRDTVASTGNHGLDLRFHFAAGADTRFGTGKEPGKPTSCDAQAAAGGTESAGLEVVVFGAESGPEGRWSREEGSVSQCYGNREAAPVCTFSAHFSANRGSSDEVITLLLPNSGGASSKFEVREVEAIGGRAFAITSEEHRDLVMLREPNATRIETVRLVSDFAWTWARFSQVAQEADELGELLELLVLDGQRLELDGKEILKSAKRIDYLMASREGDHFRVETSEGLLELSFPISDLAELFTKSNQQSAIGN